MDDFTRYKLDKTGRVHIGDLDDDAIHRRVRQAAEHLGIGGRGFRSHVDGVAGQALRRSYVPFGWGDPGFDADDDTIRCLGYYLVAFEVFISENVDLLYLDSPLDNVGQYRRIEIRSGEVVDVCRSELLGEGDLIGLAQSDVTPAHGLSRALGGRFRWFTRIGDQSLFGFGDHCFDGGSGIVQQMGRTLQDVEQLVDGGAQDVPILFGKLMDSR